MASQGDAHIIGSASRVPEAGIPRLDPAWMRNRLCSVFVDLVEAAKLDDVANMGSFAGCHCRGLGERWSGLKYYRWGMDFGAWFHVSLR